MDDRVDVADGARGPSVLSADAAGRCPPPRVAGEHREGLRALPARRGGAPERPDPSTRALAADSAHRGSSPFRRTVCPGARIAVRVRDEDAAADSVDVSVDGVPYRYSPFKARRVATLVTGETNVPAASARDMGPASPRNARTTTSSSWLGPRSPAHGSCSSTRVLVRLADDLPKAPGRGGRPGLPAPAHRHVRPGGPRALSLAAQRHSRRARASTSGHDAVLRPRPATARLRP